MMNIFSKKKASKFLIKSLLFLAILFFLDYFIGFFLNYFYFKQVSGYLYRTTYAMNHTKAEILIFGSSTANHHYYPSSFEERMNKSVYNTGRDGNTVFYNYAVLESVLKRYTPKIAILDVNIQEFKEEPESYDRLSSLLPYYKTHPYVNPIIQLRSPYEKYKFYSKIYPFNSLIFAIAVGNTEFNKSREHISDEKGYIPLKQIWSRPIGVNTSHVKYKLDSNRIHFFNAFIRNCVTANVKLYLVVSPRFSRDTFEDTSIIIAKKMATESNIPFFDFSKDAEFLNNGSLFADIGHLNDKGAKIFSNKVIDDILQYQLQHPMNFIDLQEINQKAKK